MTAPYDAAYARVALGIIIQAIRDYHSDLKLDGRHIARTREPGRWLWSESKRPMSARWICDCFDVDLKNILEKIDRRDVVQDLARACMAGRGIEKPKNAAPENDDDAED